ncbi:hypothetical protein WI90_17575 [Burkholderia ubonensis]|nr:hypothetical protein WI90_17575 [Burkholderia ubonensis]
MNGVQLSYESTIPSFDGLTFWCGIMSHDKVVVVRHVETPPKAGEDIGYAKLVGIGIRVMARIATQIVDIFEKA